MNIAEVQPTAAVVPFPGLTGRRVRPGLRGDEPRGEILLFTGVRYDRPLEPNPTSPRPGLARRRS